MVILSMDQGIASFGFAVFSVDKSGVELLKSGCYTSTANGNQQKRIYNLMSKIEKLIVEYKPTYMVHERLFFSPPAKNSRKKSASILNTNMITGVLWYLAAKHNALIAQFSPQTVKKTLCGNGRAEKEDVIKYIEERFEINCPITHKEHMCDAIAIGLTYIEQLKKAGAFNDSETFAEEV